ncbi:MAG: hypothetical protein ABSH20_21795 [Tepidisphaeraceae bacterium]
MSIELDLLTSPLAPLVHRYPADVASLGARAMPRHLNRDEVMRGSTVGRPSGRPAHGLNVKSLRQTHQPRRSPF